MVLGDVIRPGPSYQPLTTVDRGLLGYPTHVERVGLQVYYMGIKSPVIRQIVSLIEGKGIPWVLYVLPCGL